MNPNTKMGLFYSVKSPGNLKVGVPVKSTGISPTEGQLQVQGSQYTPSEEHIECGVTLKILGKNWSREVDGIKIISLQ